MKFYTFPKLTQFETPLQALLDFLTKSERKFDNLGPIGTDIDHVKKQISQLKEFKDEVDPWMIKVEALNRSVLTFNSHKIENIHLNLKQFGGWRKKLVQFVFYIFFPLSPSQKFEKASRVLVTLHF